MSEQTAVKTAKKKEDIYLELQKLQSEYDEKSKAFKPKQLVLEKKSYVSPTDDELFALAKAYADEKSKATQKSLKDTAITKKQQLLDSVTKALSAAESDNKKRESDYEKAFLDLENQAIKRGVQRSSVAVGEIAKLHENRISESDADNKKLTEKVSDLEKEIAKTETDLSNSLNALDMENAVVFNEKLAALKQERQKNIDEVIAFNNKVTEAEIKYNGQKHEVVDEEGLKDVNREYNRKKLSTVLNYYLAFDNPSEAFNDFVSDEELEKYLGDYYNYAYNVIKNLI